MSIVNIPHVPVRQLFRSNRFAGLKLLTRQLGVKLNLDGYIGGAEWEQEQKIKPTI
jgi:hypothetical protein